MHNFFVEDNCRISGCYYIAGADLNHIKNVLRMRIGDEFLVSCNGITDLCRLQSVDDNTAVAEIIEENYKDTNLSIDIHLFQVL